MSLIRLFFLAGLIISGNSFCQDYSSLFLDKKLTENANAIIRKYDMNYTVTDTGKATIHCHMVCTVLNKNGDDFATFVELYDKFRSLTDLKGKIYNAAGSVVRKIKTSDFIDQSAISDYSLYEDNRVKICRPLVNTYPYTVEYEWTLVQNGIYRYPPWSPQEYYDLAVENSTFTITVPKNFNIRFKTIHYDEAPVKSENDLTKSFSFQVKDLPALEREPLSTGIADLTPAVYAIPDHFKLNNLTGDTKSWEDLGKWFRNLNNQPNNLSDKTKAELAAIKSGSLNREDLIRKVYEYMQSKTRYVSIQMGIGGLKPFDASVVDKYGYGDCKALSNYMNVLLEEVNIPSFYTLVRAGNNAKDIFRDQVFDVSNHVILCVPDTKDTLWLECTSQVIPFGFLGMFTDNRNVLLITPEGGKIVKTQVYKKEQNQMSSKGIMKITPEGNVEGQVKTTYTGLQYDENSRWIYESPEKQKENLYSEIDLPSFTLKDFRYDQKKERIPSMSVSVTITVPKYANPMGERLLLPLNLVNRVSPLPPLLKERKSPFRLRYSYLDTDTINYELPEGFELEFTPDPVSIKTEFGEYSEKAVLSPDKKAISYIRMRTHNEGIYPPEKYKDYITFVKEISKLDNLKISLLKKN